MTSTNLQLPCPSPGCRYQGTADALRFHIRKGHPGYFFSMAGGHPHLIAAAEALFVCAICGVRFVSRKGLTQHQKKVGHANANPTDSPPATPASAKRTMWAGPTTLTTARKPGSAQGQIKIASNFDDPKPSPVQIIPQADGTVHCPIPNCHALTQNINSMRDHLRRVHDMLLVRNGETILAKPAAEGQYTCPECGRHFITPAGRGTHIARMHRLPLRQQTLVRAGQKSGLPTLRKAVPVEGDGITVSRWDRGLYLVRIPKFGMILGPRVKVTVEPLEEEGE